MVTHKLQLDDFDEDEYDLLAIHTTIEDYRLAFLLNQKLPIQFSKNKNPIVIPSKSESLTFNRFSYHLEEDQILWDLIPNKQEKLNTEKGNGLDLFELETTETYTIMYFLPEFKKVDYFIKIENATIDLNEIIALINSISVVSSCYIIQKEKIKSTNNLIF